jgi:hypothetical protein
MDAYASHLAEVLVQEFCAEAAKVRAALTAPHVLYRPCLSADGDQWCALLGDNLQEGVSGFGDTPAAAMAAFDETWTTGRTPTAVRLALAEA